MEIASSDDLLRDSVSHALLASVQSTPKKYVRMTAMRLKSTDAQTHCRPKWPLKIKLTLFDR
ncbi:hypothetical protein GN244_ATG15629 [Phytophthora infestans]|uniref:Uncharacterized protein n=1 Tax=Phytophthora infestans TaxID=4787 RepID=A0A833W868_PHYIN|nr:hypothetical protein GN244_ATG15629 [Phytophthora infestans]KAF4141508.1 hypothetical protein GN958_ATG09306 [Phytophthora infestans]